MSGTIWLHIGTGKSGTTSLQRALRDIPEDLAAHGLRYVVPKGASSANAFAVAINKGRAAALATLRDDLTAQIEAAGALSPVLSSEMLYGIAPDAILDALPILRDRPLNILVYLRRQDRYIESKYLQKLKNGMFRGDIDAFIDRFDGSGSDYLSQIDPWTKTHATLHPRICETARLFGGSTVTDALCLLGSPKLAEHAPASDNANTSSSLERIQLLHALQDAGHPLIKRIQRALPPDPQGKAQFMSATQKRAFLARYETSNEALRQAFFSDQDSLFDQSGLKDDTPTPSTGFTQAQLSEIETMFRLLLSGK